MKLDFDRVGFAVVSRFFWADKIREIASEVDGYIDRVLPNVSPVEAFYEDKNDPATLKYIHALDRHDDYFRDLLNDSPFIGVAEALLGARAVGQHLSLVRKPPRVGKETPPHQDAYYARIRPLEAVTLWLPLDAATEYNGCLRYQPGSQRGPLRSHGPSGVFGFVFAISDYSEADRAREVPVPVRPGDLLVHHCMTIHRADANDGSHDRRALSLLYYSERAREEIADAHQRRIIAEHKAETP